MCCRYAQHCHKAIGKFTFVTNKNLSDSNPHVLVRLATGSGVKACQACQAVTMRVLSVLWGWNPIGPIWIVANSGSSASPPCRATPGSC